MDIATAGKSGIPTSVVSTIKVAAPPANAQKSPVTGGKGEQSLHKQICVPFVKMKKVAARPRKLVRQQMIYLKKYWIALSQIQRIVLVFLRC